MSEANLRDKAMFLYNMRKLRQKWDADDRRFIGELRREYWHPTTSEERKNCIKIFLQHGYGVEP